MTLTDKDYEDLKRVYKESEERLNDIRIIRGSMLKLLYELGLTTDDKKKIKPEYVNKEKSILKPLIKSGTKYIAQATLAQFDKVAHEEFMQKFSFIDDIKDILIKYENLD